MDSFSGGAGNDTISGLVGVSGTFGVGDTVVGGAGTDTLNLLVQSGGQSQLVSLAGVENVNARLLEAGPASALALNAIDWAGVTTLSFNSSLDETAIRVSGLTTEASISINNEVDVTVDFRALTSGTDAVSLTLTSAGSGGGTAASLASAGVADIELDLDDVGLIDTVNVNLAAGTNYATLEAGADARTLNITGAGNLYLSTDDLLTSINATGAAGNLNITITGASEAVVKGGAGNDTLILGTTLTNSDSFDGGSGADTITATVGGFNRTFNTQNVETATITFTDSGELTNSSTTNITTYNVSAGSAGVAASIAQIADGATINLTNDGLGAVTLDYASGAATTTIKVGSATWSADVGLASLAVTDVASVTLNAVTGISAGATALITTATFDADVKAIVVQTLGGTGSFEIGDGGNASIGGATALTFNANGAANINFDSIVAGAATLTTLSVNTYGVAAGSATLIGVSGTAMTAINLNASGAGGIEIGAVTLGNGSKTGEAAAVSINVTQGAEADIAIGAITTTGGSTVTINAANIQSSGSFYVADVIFSKGTDGSTTGLTQNFTLNAVTVGTAASFEIEAIDLEAATAGAQITIGNILVQNGGAFDFGSASGISASGVANVDVSSINVTIEGSGSATFGGIETTGGAVGTITLNVGTAASATFGTITASAIGAISVMASGSTGASAAGIDFGNMSSETTIGALEIAGVDGANVTFGTIGASGSLGAIAVSGAVDVVIGVVTTTRVGTISTTGQNASGSFQINLSGVTNAVELNLGIGANTIISGDGNDVLTLTGSRTAAAGNDTIRFVSSTDGIDQVVNFIAGNAASGGDQFEIDVSEFGLALRDGDGSAIGAAVSDLTVAVSGATTIATTDNVIVLTTAFASTATMQNFVDSEITLGTAVAGSGNLVVVWTNGIDSYVSLIDFDATGGDLTLASASGSIVVSTLAEITGVTPGAFVAANFEFV